MHFRNVYCVKGILSFFVSVCKKFYTLFVSVDVDALQVSQKMDGVSESFASGTQTVVEKLGSSSIATETTIKVLYVGTLFCVCVYLLNCT